MREEPTLKADPSAQRRLLDLQELDSRLDQLDHRLKTLPEQAELARLAERRTDLSARHGRLRTQVDDLGRDQRKADADVEQVKARRDRNRSRIDTGAVSDPKQLQALQHEMATLDRRISDLEDEELVVMESLEEAQRELAAAAAELAEVEAAGAEALRRRDAAVADINQTQAAGREERTRLVEAMPPDLLKLYDRLRGQQDGVGVGALHRGRCGGCRLDIGAADLARMAAAPADEVLRCEQCNRILVRTTESGV